MPDEPSPAVSHANLAFSILDLLAILAYPTDCLHSPDLGRDTRDARDFRVGPVVTSPSVTLSPLDGRWSQTTAAGLLESAVVAF